MSLQQDQYYIDKVINGDTNAFSVLVDRYKYMVYTLAVRMVKNNEEAEEVAQDTFLKVYKSLPSFKGDSKFSTWVYKIAYNRSLDYIKKLGRIPETALIEEYAEHNRTSLASAIDQFEIDERKETIKRAMQELPADYATILTLHYFEELSLKEISKIMDASPDTLKVKLFRARKRLGGILKDRLQEKI
ncbi:RNA polymerase sigma factor [Ulvibacterium sp.]|uniref:RNA polymerase sigma factor n=1 Tax=Ulvibacterium sp. TaxID=2665914 RepID=UPI003BAD2854